MTKIEAKVPRAILALVTFLLLALFLGVPITWIVIKRVEQKQVGPNPDGSWGSYAEPIRVTGVRINTGVLGETRGASEMLLLNTTTITIYMTIDVGTEDKYTTHITLPVDTVIPKTIEE